LNALISFNLIEGKNNARDNDDNNNVKDDKNDARYHYKNNVRDDGHQDN
jgi:hypothetical protein